MSDPAQKIVSAYPRQVKKQCAFTLALLGLVYALCQSFYPHVLAEMFSSYFNKGVIRFADQGIFLEKLLGFLILRIYFTGWQIWNIKPMRISSICQQVKSPFCYNWVWMTI